MVERAPHPKAKSFAYWIAGYQEFCEPIVRAYLEDQGYEPVLPRTIVGVRLTTIIEQIEAKRQQFQVPPERLDWALNVLRRKAGQKQGRVQLDVLARGREGLITGEIKSWGGYSGPVTWKTVLDVFVNGSDGLFLYLTQINVEPVAGNLLVLWKRSDEHDEIEMRLSALFGRPVKIVYLDEIHAFRTGKTAESVRTALSLLDDAVDLVRTMISP
jgi:hypothetical protein